MAEFKDVIKAQKRMCDAMENCGQCPLIDADCACRFSCMIEGDFDSAETEIIEHIVMDWVAKHPEPRYPTWDEWYKATFPNSNYHTIPCPSMFYKICETSNYHGEVECYECKNSPIPADIAEQLGIKPIGGDTDA